MHSFLLIGQSNMAGRGYFHEAKEIDSSRIFTLRNGRWHPMFRPINPDRSFSGVNLAESFAEQYAKANDVDVGLICCADGGTSLDQWQPGGVLFDHAVLQAQLAQRTSTIVGILWHQGEADCAEELYSTYQTRFETMLTALRKALNLPDVPVLLGGLGDFLKFRTSDPVLANYTHVNDALKCIAQNDPAIGFVSAEGLAPNPDNLHFSAAALYDFGIRYFEEHKRLCGQTGISVEEMPDSDLNRREMELL